MCQGQICTSQGLNTGAAGAQGFCIHLFFIQEGRQSSDKRTPSYFQQLDKEKFFPWVDLRSASSSAVSKNHSISERYGGLKSVHPDEHLGGKDRCLFSFAMVSEKFLMFGGTVYPHIG